MTPTPSRRGTTARPAVDRGWIVGVITHHPFAKLFSLAAATVLMILIDLELTKTIFEANVTIVSEATSRDRGVLHVTADDEYMVLIEDESKKARLVIEGKNKQRDALLQEQPFRAHLPTERLQSSFASAGAGLKEPPLVTVEKTDLRLGISVNVVELGSLQVRVAERGQKRVLLTWANRDPRLEVAFRTPEVEITGPRPYVDRLTSIPIAVGEKGLSPSELGGAIAAWFANNPDDGIRRWSSYFSVVDAGSLKEVTAKPIAEKPKDIRLTVLVRALITLGSPLLSAQNPYEIQIGDAGTDGRVELTFSGPTSKIVALERDQDLQATIASELAGGVKVDINENELRRLRDENKENPDAWWHSWNADLIYDTTFLTRHGLTPTRSARKVSIKARLRK